MRIHTSIDYLFKELVSQIIAGVNKILMKIEQTKNIKIKE